MDWGELRMGRPIFKTGLRPDCVQQRSGSSSRSGQPRNKPFTKRESNPAVWSPRSDSSPHCGKRLPLRAELSSLRHPILWSGKPSPAALMASYRGFRCPRQLRSEGFVGLRKGDLLGCDSGSEKERLPQLRVPRVQTLKKQPPGSLLCPFNL